MITFDNGLYRASYKGTEVSGEDRANVWAIFIQALTNNGLDPWEVIRESIAQALATSDFTQATDSPLSTGQKQLWRVYRQTLREIPRRYSDPAQVVWPAEPTEIQLKQTKLAENRPAFVDDTIILED